MGCYQQNDNSYSPEFETVTTNSHVSIGVLNFKIRIETKCIENIETETKETLKIWMFRYGYYLRLGQRLT